MGCGIDDETIELYVMGRLQDPAIRSHLEDCPDCLPRVIECRGYVEILQQALRELQVTHLRSQ